MELAASYFLKALGAVLVLCGAFLDGAAFPALFMAWMVAVAIGYSATVLASKARRER